MSFSCLISCFKKDKPDELKKCLISLVNQTKPADEIIFVKDGLLTDDLENILFEFKSKLPLVFISLKDNMGLGNALKVGLESCSNEIVIRMDTDDICYPNRFEIQYNFLIDNPMIDILGTWAHDINADDQIIGERKYPIKHKDIYKLIWTIPIIHPSVAFRKSKILSIGSYNSELSRRQDYDLWLRSAYGGFVFGNIPEFLIKYRFTENYYNKNNNRVAFDQAIMGLKGAKKLKLPKYVYIAVFIPLFRSILPRFLMVSFHKLMNKFDPRNKIK
jgi:glycosyltransferase involved in cell wall biosynthesis